MRDFAISPDALRGDEKAISQQIETSIRDLANGLLEYVEYTSKPGTRPIGVRPQITLRSAPLGASLQDAIHGERSRADLGITRLPGFLQSFRPDAKLFSNHERVQISSLERTIYEYLEELRLGLGCIAILGHDELQIEISSYPSNDINQHIIKISVDGISLQAGPKEPELAASEIARNLTSINDLFGEDFDGPPATDWSYYICQNHLIRAPGPGWALLKLQSLIQCRRITADDLTRFKRDLEHPVFRVEPMSSILKDFD